MVDALNLAVAVYLSTIAHELGHYAFGRACGYVPTSAGMGTGRPFLVFGFRGCRFYLAPKHPFQGLTFTIHPDIVPTRRATVVMTAGGILVNLGIALLCVPISLLVPAAGHVCTLVGGVNLFLAATSSIPSRSYVGTSVLLSDGAQIAALLRPSAHEAPTSARVGTVMTWRPHWEAVGDQLNLCWNLLSNAIYWCELGDPARGEQWLQEADALPIDRPPYLQAFSTYIHGAFYYASGRLPEARAALRGASLEAPGCGASRFLARLVDGEISLAEGEAPTAAAALDRLAVEPLHKYGPEMARALLSARVRAHLWSDSPEAGGLVADWERARKRNRSPREDSQVLYVLAQAHARQGRQEAAAGAYDQLIVALQATYHSLLNSPEAQQFSSQLQPILLEAEAAYAAAGRPRVNLQLSTVFPPPEEIGRWASAALIAQSIRRLRIGSIWAVANLMLGALGGALLVQAHNLAGLSGMSFSLPSLVALLAFFSVVGMLYGLGYPLLKRWNPAARSDAGTVMILIAALPWIFWGLFSLLIQRF